jgi:tetratricopeptide (TPR) repeat protein
MSKSVFFETLERGVTAHQAGRLDDALKSYRAALELRPNDPEASSLCGLALLHSGKGDEAMPLLQQAVDREPRQNGFRLNLAEGFAQTGNPDRAMVELGLIVATEPTNLVALGRFYALECDALVARREWSKLYTNGVAWTKADPSAPSAWRARARGAFEEGQLVEAVNSFSRYLTLTKPTVADYTAYASLCLQALYTDDAIRALDLAEGLDANYPQMLAQRALALMYLGRFAEAESYARRCVTQKPDFVPAYSTLSRLRRGALDDADLKQLNELARSGDVYLDYRIAAIFAIANAHDARGEIDAAFAAYDAAHMLSRERDAFERRSYDPAQDAARIQRAAGSWERLPEIPPVANAPRPIFIVGMPRSGTTLLEAVLGAHSRVFACGERPTLRQILRWPSLEQTPPDQREQTLQDWAKFYFRDVPEAADRRGADHITDKHPRNFEAAGFITRLLPNAVIVHVRRNPVETCLSVYRQEFNKNWTFTHRLADIAEYYVRYARLVAQWERVLPPEKFFTIQYEDFVADFANAAPKLVQACGLEWEPQCLEFQKSARPIATFSTVQARSAVALGNGRALRYEKFLGPLIAALEAGGIDLQTGAMKLRE